jgi:TorA maturation chaperone TorD
VYGLLSLGFSEPNEALLGELAGGELAAEARAAASRAPFAGARGAAAVAEIQRCAAAVIADPSGEALCALRAEYARLCTGPGRPALACYASEYLEPLRADGRGRLGGAVAAAVEEVYAAEGVATTAGRREPPDFVATELEFLYVLGWREACAEAAGDAAEARRLRAVALEFLDGHAGRWLPMFAAAARQESREPLYTALAELLACCLPAAREDGRRAWRERGLGAAGR